MHFRKLLDWRKALIYTHRWLGIAFGLLFVSWFISGVAFMYWGMLALTAKERLDHQKPVDLSIAAVAPLEAARRNNIRPGSLRLEMHGDRPVYRMGEAAVFADTGEPLVVAPADREGVEIIRKWVPEHARS